MTSEFETRELCPDGACIGLIGPDGRCKECGIVAPSAVSDPRERGLNPKPAEEGDPWPERELCPDDACIGVIGDDRRCHECGTELPGAEAQPAENTEETAGSDNDAGTDEDDEFESRQLCPDGACIGLIGPDGSCKECGATGATAEPG